MIEVLCDENETVVVKASCVPYNHIGTNGMSKNEMIEDIRRYRDINFDRVLNGKIIVRKDSTCECMMCKWLGFPVEKWMK